MQSLDHRPCEQLHLAGHDTGSYNRRLAEFTQTPMPTMTA